MVYCWDFLTIHQRALLAFRRYALTEGLNFMRTKRALSIVLVAACTIIGFGCQEKPDFTNSTVSYDIQPDITKYWSDTLPDICAPGPAPCNGLFGSPQPTDPNPHYGHKFVYGGDIFAAGGSTKIGFWLCHGTKVADMIPGADLNSPIVLQNLLDGQYAYLSQAFLIDGLGTILTEGVEPGFDGQGGQASAIVGGTGAFVGAQGQVTVTFAQGNTLTPDWAAPGVSNWNGSTVPVPKTPWSRRVAFQFLRTSASATPAATSL